ncbi:MAG: carbohydrate kinase family protein [Chloroflexota bacterium]
MKTVITGSIAFDYLMSFPGRFSEHLLAEQLENISVSFLVDSMRRMRGGVAPNIAYTNALLGGRPTIMATAGRDFGAYRQWLEEQGIDTSAIVTYDDVYCASFFVNTDQEQNQIASFYTGAMAKAIELTFASNVPDAELAIISPNDPQAMNSYVAECKDRHLAYIYDPSQQTIRLSAEDLRLGLDGCALLTVNEYELHMIQEKTGLSLDQILAISGGLLLTMGKRGSRIYVDDRILEIPAIAPRKLVEPTGAGDAFRGGLLRGVQLGLPWEITGRIGALAATYVLENFGTQGHYYTAQEFVDRYREHFDDQGALDILLT